VAPILGLFKSVVVTLTYLRRNWVQAEIGEAFGVSQSTISRAVAGLSQVLGQVLAGYVPVAEDLDTRTQYIVDGTLLPCWSWRDRPALYSGKHRTTGVNVQVVCDLYGRLAWIDQAPQRSNRIPPHRPPPTRRPTTKTVNDPQSHSPTPAPKPPPSVDPVNVYSRVGPTSDSRCA
jgi:transcriptional regulator with XRE-family HTH domain